MDRECKTSMQASPTGRTVGIVGMKQKRAAQLPERGEFGDAYTFVALDADTKLVPCFHVGRRTAADTTIFIDDCAPGLLTGLKSRQMLSSPITMRSCARSESRCQYAQLVISKCSRPI